MDRSQVNSRQRRNGGVVKTRNPHVGPWSQSQSSNTARRRERRDVIMTAQSKPSVAHHKTSNRLLEIRAIHGDLHGFLPNRSHDQPVPSTSFARRVTVHIAVATHMNHRTVPGGDEVLSNQPSTGGIVYAHQVDRGRTSVTDEYHRGHLAPDLVKLLVSSQRGHKQ